jgi:hypothetical protein
VELRPKQDQVSSVEPEAEAEEDEEEEEGDELAEEAEMR